MEKQYWILPETSHFNFFLFISNHAWYDLNKLAYSASLTHFQTPVFVHPFSWKHLFQNENKLGQGSVAPEARLGKLELFYQRLCQDLCLPCSYECSGSEPVSGMSQGRSRDKPGLVHLAESRSGISLLEQSGQSSAWVWGTATHGGTSWYLGEGGQEETQVKISSPGEGPTGASQNSTSYRSLGHQTGRDVWKPVRWVRSTLV